MSVNDGDHDYNYISPAYFKKVKISAVALVKMVGDSPLFFSALEIIIIQSMIMM
jgi:hypothetical protein